ncbi:hypothetical protein [Bartonella sp. AP58NXGY]|uniref:hypothetical protein n=1 Tax=Bartonella sp. AP58NXGY TaxID=3243498 RepID=UPI0035CFD632
MFRRIGTTGGFWVLLWWGVFGGAMKVPPMMAKLPDKCFFIGEEMVLVVLLFIKKESFEGRFLADMGKGCRGMRKSLCGVKWAYWGKDWGAGCGKK